MDLRFRQGRFTVEDLCTVALPICESRSSRMLSQMLCFCAPFGDTLLHANLKGVQSSEMGVWFLGVAPLQDVFEENQS